MRRYKNALYFTDELIQKALEERPVKVWDCVNMFFPRETNKKQFDCALKFLQEIDKRKVIGNIEALELYDTPNERFMLTGTIIPKFKKFELRCVPLILGCTSKS